ncbi:MAG TPA: heme ABC exporter ATP-binding protein CcmA [Longimicrobiales bacterium]|nr:heme ABC exporter ATP-binding protein CcmA [Longimicrobiales bacterium]
MDTADAINLTGVARRFGRRWALRGITMRASAGESLMLLGRNGSGKTTLLRVLSTSLAPTRGAGTVLGHALGRSADRIRPLVAWLGHDPGLYGDLTGVENLRFSERMRRPIDGSATRDGRIAGALERVDLAAAGDERTRGYSAGMKRRLALARVLLAEPRLLLLDEPYASFDESGIQLVNEVVRAMREAGGCVVVATHDRERSAEVATRALRLEDGLLYDDELGAVSSRSAVPGVYA